MWIAYGGVFTSMSFCSAAPSPRFATGTNGAAPAPYVSVPLTVMFPLGPEIVALYLSVRQ